jgi:hypothetical protein
MKKSLPHQEVVNESSHKEHNQLSPTMYENMIIDNNSLLLREDSDSSYKCIFDKCGALLENKIDLEEHCTRHIRTKYFKCDVFGCDKVYRSKENLTLHIKNIHLNLKPYKCRFCNSTFSHRNGTLILI